MNRDQVLILAREVDARLVDMFSGKTKINFMDDQLVAFASRIESATREECAKICDEVCSLPAVVAAERIRKSEG